MRILLVGDSQAQGVASALRAVLAAAGHELVADIDQVGITTYGLISLTREAPAADLTLVLVGGNDWSLSSLPSAIAQLRAQLPGVVVWVGPLQANDTTTATRHAAAARVQAAYAAQLGYRWIDGVSLSSGLEHAADGIHFTGAGYRALAQNLLGALFPSNAALWIGLTVFGLAVAGFTFWIGSRR